MNFLATSLLFGAFAFAIPLAIHLLRKSHPTPVNWAAMHLLEFSHESKKFRIRWREWLLLALRCALPIILAAILARPVLTRWTGFIGDSPQQIVLLVDDTASMQPISKLDQKSKDLPTRKNKTRNQIADLAGNLREHHDLRIVRFSALADKANFKEDFRTWDAVSKAITVEFKDDERQQLIVLSDFRGEDWLNQNQLAAVSNVAKANKNLNRISFIPSGHFEPSDWVTLTGRPQSLLPVFVGESLALETSLNFTRPNQLASTESRPSFQIFAETDEGKRFEETLTITELGSVDTKIDVWFETVGQHRIKVRLSSDLLDNTTAAKGVSHREYYQVIDVIEPQSVAILVGDKPNHQLQAEIFKLAFESGSTERTRFRVNLFPLNETLEESLTDFSAILVVDWENLSKQRAMELERFVSTGGHLITSLPNSDLDDSRFGNESARGYLAAFAKKILPLFPFTLESSSDDSKAKLVDVNFLTHRAVSNLSSGGNSELEAVRIRRWMEPMTTERRANIDYVLRTETGQPLILQSEIDQGMVTQLGIGLDRKESNIASQAIFPVVMQQILLTRMMSSRVTFGTSFESQTGFFANGRKIGWSDTVAQGSALIATNLKADEKLEIVEEITPSRLSEFSKSVNEAANDKLQFFADTAEFRVGFVESQTGREIWYFGVGLLACLMFVEILLLRN